jgi:hypothetical protein
MDVPFASSRVVHIATSRSGKVITILLQGRVTNVTPQLHVTLPMRVLGIGDAITDLQHLRTHDFWL